MKVGDTVRIKTNLKELDDEEIGIAPEMFAYEGAIAHIVNVTEGFGIDNVNLGYLLDIDNEDWVWSENWLENIDDTLTGYIDTLASYLKDKIENVNILVDSLRNEIENIGKEKDELRKENKELKERLAWRVNYCQELEHDLYENMEEHTEANKLKKSINKIEEILKDLKEEMYNENDNL